MNMVDAKIEALALTDPAAAAAYRLRHKGECPVCRGKVRDRENSTTSMRMLACAGCGWSREVPEWHWQSLPEIHLKKVTAEVLSLKRRAIPAPARKQEPKKEPEQKRESFAKTIVTQAGDGLRD